MPDPARSVHEPSRAARLLAGPVLTLALAGAIELLRATPLHLPEPGVVMLLAVAVASFVGGWLPGAISALLGVAYTTWFFMGPSEAAPADALGHQGVVWFGAPLLVVLLSVQRARTRRALAAARAAGLSQHYQELFEEAGESIFVMDRDERLLFVNRVACETTGFAREVLMGRRFSALFSPESLGRQPSRIAEVLRRGSLHAERELMRADGTRFPAEISARVIGGERVVSVVRDVSRARAEVARLQEALSRVRATLESTADGILVVNSVGRWVDFNQTFVEMWRIPADILESGDDARALAFVLSQLAAPDEFMARVRHLYADAGSSGFDELAMRDGRVIERYSIPQRIDERVVGRVWSFRDVTEVRRAAQALRDTEKLLLEAQKLEAVGRLAGGIAHDFNNMLTAILGEADLVLQQPDLGAPTRTHVENLRDAALRSARLTRQLLTFARRHPLQPRAVDLGALVAGLEPLIRGLIGRSVDLRLDLPAPGTGPHVHADPSQLEQAILNLVINAGDAMPGGGTLAIRVGRMHVGEDDRARRGARVAGPHALLAVTDSGSGIPEHVRPHLFEPFFTTKPLGEGTGLGLASVHVTIQQSHGFIEVDSPEPGGATFRVHLPERPPPAAPAPPAEAPAPDAAPPPVAPQEQCVLLVDDEGQVRGFVQAVLARAGYEVVAAASPGEALALARTRGTPIALMLSDVVMPGGGGPELARTLLAEGLVERVLFMSGYPGDTIGEEFAAAGTVEIVPKPFRAADLLERVRALLAAPPAR